MEVGLGPGDFVLDGDPVWHPTLLWPNGWMDEDATWYGSRIGAGHIVLDGFPALRERGTAPPLF